MDTPTTSAPDSAHPIEAFYDLPGVQGVTNFVHWIDAQLMAWSAFFLIVAVLLAGLDNTTDYVSRSGLLTAIMGISIVIGVESQIRTLLKYARMSWDAQKKGVATAWFLSAMPVVVVAGALVWMYMVKAAEHVSEDQAAAIIGLSVRIIEFGRTAVLMYLLCMSALAYFVKPRETLAQRLAAKHEEAALIAADAEIVQAQQVKRDAQLRAAAQSAVGARQVGSAAWRGQLAEGAYPAQPLVSATDRAYAQVGMPVASAPSFFRGDDDDDTPPPTSPAPTTGGGRGARGLPSGSLGERGRPSYPITRYADSDLASRAAQNVAADVKDFLLSESRRFASGQLTHVPTQQEVLRYLQDCGHGFRGVSDAVKAAIASALTMLADEGITLAWDVTEASPQAMAS